MTKVSLFCLSLLILCGFLNYADCKEKREYEKGWKKHKNSFRENQLSNEFQLNNIDADNESKAEWYERQEHKKNRHSSRKEAHPENHGARRERDVDQIASVPPNFNGPLPIPDPPAHNKVAEVARFIVHHSAWASGAYKNYQPGMEGLPMATLLSVSDGFANASTGTPYMYITSLSIAVQDLAKDNHLSLLMSLAQTDYCTRKEFDPEDPRCAYVVLTGKLKEIRNGTDEWNFAQSVYLDRHPGMRNVPAGHKFRFAKFKIHALAVQDYFGGIKFPSVTDYYKAKVNETTEERLAWS